MGQQPLVGRRIAGVRPMTKTEMQHFGWDGWAPGIVVELDDGTKLYPSRDPEGNGPGALIGSSAISRLSGPASRSSRASGSISRRCRAARSSGTCSR